MQSMTGYGKAEAKLHNLNLSIEVKSVNHRFCDVHVRLPKLLSPFEEAIKQLVQKRINRGRVEVSIHLSGEEYLSPQVMVNWALADAYHQSLLDLKQRYGLSGEITLQDLLQYPDLITLHEDTSVESYQEPLLVAVNQAMDQLVQMRCTEGAALAKDLAQRLKRVKVAVEQVERLAPQVRKHYQERLERRLQEFLASRVELDEERLLTEVALFAEKADVSEECVRLKSHCSQFNRLLSSMEPVGRKLDFLIQEMNREVNTIGSKAHSVKISELVIELKSELEKIREQIQNIE